ncbi:alpha-N-acetylglucosaminidase C-terminal domain-containing protein, partial [Clostridium tarantellae]
GVLATEIPNAYKTTSTGKTSHMKGIGITPEALESNPVLFDLLFEMAWTTDVVNVELWLKDYIERRYGKYTDNAYNAWKVFNETAYAKRTHYHEGASESIINARPKFGVRSSALVGSITVLYDKIKFEEAVKLLLADYDELKDYPGYLFDLADYLRQVLANSAQEYYNKFVSLYNANDSAGFKLYADKFLNLIKLQEKILSTQRVFLVGTWIKYAKEEAFDDFSTDMFKLNSKALITTWGGLLQSEAGGLRDYSNRQWSGLTGDFYYGRWEMWINSLKNAIDTGTEPKNIDWFKFDWTWVINNKEYSSEPTNFSLKDLGNEVFTNFSYSKLI